MYNTEIEYTSNLFPEQGPAVLGLVCALNGVRPPPLTEDFTYCDLGCGTGLSVAAFAAASPRGSFWGVDVMPEHITAARRLCEASGLGNARFLEADFSTMPLDALPECDYIALHGVYGWVDERVRAQLRALIGARLKPGGALYISYNAMPGAIAFATLREIMLRYTASMRSQDAMTRARKGMEYLRFLLDHNAEVFRASPRLTAFANKLLARDLRYIVHEFFTSSWRAYRVAEIADALEPLGLSFVGSAAPLEANELALSLPGGFVEEIAGLDRLEQETRRDLICGTLFRRDVFVKGPTTVDPEAALRAMTLVATEPRESLGRPASLQHQTVTFKPEQFDWLFDAMEHGEPVEVEALCAEAVTRGVGAEQALRSLRWLLLCQRARPVVGRARTSSSAGSEVRLTQANRALLDAQLPSGPRVVGISTPGLGGGQFLTLTEGLILRALDGMPGEALEGDAGCAQLCARVHALVTARGLSPRQRGSDGPGEVEASVRVACQRFLETRLNHLHALGVIEGAAGRGGGRDGA